MSGLETKRDKKGRSMAFVTLEDLVGDVEVVVFSSIFEKSSEQLKEGEVVVISGRVDSSRESAKVIADEVASFASLQRRAQNLHIRIAVDQTDIDLERLKEVLLAHRGKTPVFLHLDAGGHPVIMRSRSIKVRFSEALARELEHMVRKDAVWLSEN